MSAKQSLYEVLQWLDNNVREPMQGSVLDKLIATPLKNAYCQTRKQF